MLQKFGKDFLLFHMNIDSIKSISSSLDKVSAFYKDIITHWIKVKNSEKDTSKDFMI